MKVLNIIAAAAASMALMAACSSKTSSDAAATQTDSTAVAAPAEAVIEVAAGDTTLSFSTPLAIIDFNATWCGPCMRMSPVIDELAQQYEGQVQIGKYNIEEETELSDEYRIMSIPTILFFKNGEQVRDLRLAGSQSKAKLEENIKALLAL